MGRARNRKKGRQVTKPLPSPRAGLVQRARATVVGFLPIVAIVLVTRQAVAEAYRIPSGSMEPTLLVGDWIMVNNLRFGPHVPFTQRSLPGYAAPARNDVAVFQSPPQDFTIRITPDDVTPMLVKRIIGVPGDTVMMRRGELSVNGVPVPPRNTSFVVADSVAAEAQPLFAWQHQIEIVGSRFGTPPARPTLHDWGPLVIPAEQYFMMGDNCDDSVDSRYYGLVPRANIRGRPMFVYYSYDTEAGDDYLRAIMRIRWRRLGTWIR